MLSGLYFYKSGDWGQYTLFHNVSSRTLELFMLVNSFRRAAELKVLVLVLWHAASNEGKKQSCQMLTAIDSQKALGIHLVANELHDQFLHL